MYSKIARLIQSVLMIEDLWGRMTLIEVNRMSTYMKLANTRMILLTCGFEALDQGKTTPIWASILQIPTSGSACPDTCF